MTEHSYRNIMNLLIVASVLLTPFSFWLAIGSERFIQQAELQIDGTEVYFKRYTPFGTVSAEWASEIHVLDGTDYECIRGPPQFAVYQDRGSNVANYTLGDWAIPCVERGSSYTITTVRQVYIWGIPLRPFTTVDLIRVGE